ncbi:MAG TPA: hypothetical protein VFE23_14715 [Usitatibacter sp.]|jgi:hypothetical protein|nr:hypothetical protein [Usitatibacter sp.]
MQHGLKHFLMYASLLALVGTTACSTLEASFGSDESHGSAAQHDDLLKTMDHDSQAGGE